MNDCFTNPDRFADLDAWHREVDAMRASGPLVRVDRTDGDYARFWAVIGYPEVIQIERQAATFTNAPHPVLRTDAEKERRARSAARRKSLVFMDGTEHTAYRRITSDWFKPASLSRLQPRLDELSSEAIDRMLAAGGACDFVSDVAVWYPLAVILALLGLPEQDYPRLLALTQEFFGNTDPDLGRGGAGGFEAVAQDLGAYFRRITEDRRTQPREDLATVIATAQIDGSPLPDPNTLGYYVIIATAGHDTTSSALAAGMQALAEHPEALAHLQENPDLIPNAVDEMIRWTSPVRHFMRTVQAPVEVGGQVLEEGDWIYLSYLAANRDPRVFEDPHRFDVERDNADRHVAFGFGVHFCLGAQLARMELRSFFQRLIPRLDSVELLSGAATTRTVFVGGPKSLPIRYTLR